MSAWDLPTCTDIGGTTYAFRSDFRAILDVIKVLSDTSISNEERSLTGLLIFWEDFDSIPPQYWKEAADYMAWFLNCGQEAPQKKKPKLMDWEQDADLIASPINRVLGYECRTCEYLHWWSFISAYMEIGECLFAEVVNVRKKLKRGKKLEKHEREFYRDNKDLVDFKVKTTEQEDEVINDWLG